jgi:hypothetical protein
LNGTLVTLKFDKIGKWLSHLEARKPSIDTTNAGNSTTAKEQPPPNIQPLFRKVFRANSLFKGSEYLQVIM